MRYDYDANGNTTAIFTPGDVEHGFGFNAVNLNDAYVPPLSGGYAYEYDRDRRLTRKVFPSWNEIVYDYVNPDDGNDKSRLWEIRPSDGTDPILYDYSPCGTKVASVSKGSESIAYEYDASLVTSETLSGALGQTLGYTYNDEFAVDTFTYAGGTESYLYDGDGLLVGAGGFTISRNADNGLPESVGDGVLTLSRVFNGYGETDREAYSVGGDRMAWEVTERDDAGRIERKVETVGGQTVTYDYDYDAMGRLLTVFENGVETESYAYDAKGRRLSDTSGRIYGYDLEDSLMDVDGVVYEHDLDGFLIRKADGVDETLYDYSLRGELLGVSLPDGRFVEYVHDPLGRRIAKKIDGTIVEKYLWSGRTNLLAVYDGADNLLMRFEYADGRMPIAMTRGGVRYFLACDQVGTLRVVTDSTGAVVKQIDYDTFGNVVADTNPTFAVPFGFAGGLHDRDTGLVRFGYRDYDPETGRWTAKDPILFAGGDTDLYGYCLNDPVNLVDPTGEFATVVGGVVGGGIAGALAGGFVGAASSYVSGDSMSGVINSAIVGAGIGAVVGGVAGGFAGAGIIGPMGIAASDFAAGLNVGLGVGEGAALSSKLGALAGGLASIFTDPGEVYGSAESPCN